MKVKKIFTTAVLSLTLLASLVPSALAASNPNADLKASTPDEKSIRVPIDPSIQAKLQNEGGTFSITDKEQLKRIAKEEGLEKVPVKIEYEYKPINSGAEKSSIPALSDSGANLLLLHNYWVDASDEGSGWYNPTADLYKEFYVDGPDNFVISENTTKTSTYNGEFGAGIAKINAKVGFTIGSSHTITWSSTTTILAGQHIQFQLYTTYHKVWYAVYDGPEGDKQLSLCSGTGYAYDPNGQYIKKTFY